MASLRCGCASLLLTMCLFLFLSDECFMLPGYEK